MSGVYSFLDVSANMIGPTGSLDLGAGASNAEEAIVVAMKDPKNTMLIGSDGEGMHSLSASKAGTITLRYLKVSPMNAKLMAAYDAQSLSSSLWGKNLFTIRQHQSGDITEARSCSFQKKPDLKYAKDGDIIEWVFDAIKIDTVLGTYAGA